MAVTPETIGFVAPEIFKKESPDRINFFIGIASSQINASLFGPQADFATALFVAHLITVFNRKGNAQTQEEKVGDVSRKYATPAEFKNFLWTTAYGQELWALIQRQVISPYIVGDGGNNNPGGGILPGGWTGGGGCGPIF